MMGGEAVLGAGISVYGDVHSEGDLLVLGRIEGRVICGGRLRLEAGGTLKADVEARQAILAGHVEGNVVAAEDVEVLPSCRIIGDLRAARIVLHAGAAVRGQVEMGAFDSPTPGAQMPGAAAPPESSEMAEAAPMAASEPALQEAPPTPSKKMPAPPPMPASALASGLRSSVVLKRSS